MFERLDGMREVGFNGPCRFSPAHLHSAALLFDWQLAPHEVEALVMLDLVTLHPEDPEESKERTPDPAWPERKG